MEEYEEKKVSQGLSMSRVPDKTLEKFKKLANEEFCGDYGMTLKFLLDAWENFENTQAALVCAVFNLENRVMGIETSLNEPQEVPKKKIKFMSGREIEVVEK
jgi:hypothetical protein